MKIAVLLLIGLGLASTGARAEEEGEDPAKAFLRSVGASLKAGDTSAVARWFPPEGKLEIRLRGMKGGRYRSEQAKSLLAAWRRGIAPEVLKLTEVRGGTVGVFETKYKVLSDGSEVKSTLRVSAQKEGDSWRITGIVES